MRRRAATTGDERPLPFQSPAGSDPVTRARAVNTRHASVVLQLQAVRD
jgi:hypothetical protein